MTAAAIPGAIPDPSAAIAPSPFLARNHWPMPSRLGVTIALDLDSTLFDGEAEIDFTDPRSVARAPVNAIALKRTRQLFDAGYRLAAVTARTTPLLEVTLRALNDFPPMAVCLQQHWGGYANMPAAKAAGLRLVGAHAYVADRPEDATAARLAGIPFLDARHLRDADEFQFAICNCGYIGALNSQAHAARHVHGGA